MIQNGLVKEAQMVYKYKNLNALKTVGYKELFEYFSGKCTLDNAVDEIKKILEGSLKDKLHGLKNKIKQLGLTTKSHIKIFYIMLKINFKYFAYGLITNLNPSPCIFNISTFGSNFKYFLSFAM